MLLGRASTNDDGNGVTRSPKDFKNIARKRNEFDLQLAVEINAAAKEAFTAAQETKACTPLLQLYFFFPHFSLRTSVTVL